MSWYAVTEFCSWYPGMDRKIFRKKWQRKIFEKTNTNPPLVHSQKIFPNFPKIQNVSDAPNTYTKFFFKKKAIGESIMITN